MIRRKTLHSNRSFDILFFNVALLHQKHIYAYSSITCIMTFKAMDWTFLIFNFFIHSFHFQNMTLYNLIGVFSTLADFYQRELIIKVFVHLRNISRKRTSVWNLKNTQLTLYTEMSIETYGQIIICLISSVIHNFIYIFLVVFIGKTQVAIGKYSNTRYIFVI